MRLMMKELPRMGERMRKKTQLLDMSLKSLLETTTMVVMRMEKMRDMSLMARNMKKEITEHLLD